MKEEKYGGASANLKLQEEQKTEKERDKWLKRLNMVNFMNNLGINWKKFIK